MRRFVLPAALVALAAASPSHAQDWLGGIARSAAQSAAQGLVNRAVSAVTNAPPASSTGQAATAAPRGGGSPENYNADGERIYRMRDRGVERFNGQPVWRSAAQCAALAKLVDIHIADWQAKMATGGGVYRQDQIDSDRWGEQQDIERYRKLGVRRIEIDHPGRDAAGQFDAEVIRQEAALRQETWTPELTWDRRENECDSFYSALRGLIYDMEAGRGEGAKPAP